MPLARLCNENFVGVRNRILMKNICYAGVLAALLDIDLEVIRQLLAETYAQEAGAGRREHEGRAARLRLREGEPRVPAAAAPRAHGRTKGHVMIDGNTAAGLGCVYAGATVGAVVPDHAVHLADGRVQVASARSCASTRRPASNNYTMIQAEDELVAIGMVIGANWNGARAFTATSGPGISLMNEFIGLAYYAEIPAVMFDVQRVGPSTGMPTRTQQCDILIVRLRLARRHAARAAVPGQSRGMLPHGGARRSTSPSACRRRCSCCRTWTSA